VHLLLTDRITCPRCGPDFGLILLAHRVKERRVVEGEFGCANCRERYPVDAGFGDLRAPPRRPVEELPAAKTGPATASLEEDPQGALRLAALMGVTEGPGTLLITGPAASLAGEVTRLVPGVEVVAVSPRLRNTPAEEGVSRMACSPGLPFFSDTFLGVVLSGRPDRRWLAEGIRVLAPKGRVVILDASEEAGPWLKSQGLRVILDEEGIRVAEAGGERRVPLVPLRRS